MQKCWYDVHLNENGYVIAMVGVPVYVCVGIVVFEFSSLFCLSISCSLPFSIHSQNSFRHIHNREVVIAKLDTSVLITEKFPSPNSCFGPHEKHTPFFPSTIRHEYSDTLEKHTHTHTHIETFRQSHNFYTTAYYILYMYIYIFVILF